MKRNLKNKLSRSAAVVFGLIALLASPRSQAYSHAASGEGFKCEVRINLNPSTSLACNAPILKEEAAPNSNDGIDVNGNSYHTVDRFIGSPACLHSEFWGNTKASLDMSHDQSVKLSVTQDFLTVSAEAMYHQSGSIDFEQVGKKIIYINYAPAERAQQADQRLLVEVANQLLPSIQATYSANAHKLTLELTNDRGTYRESKFADMTRGSFQSAASFSVPVLGLTENGRSVALDIFCSAL